MQFCPFDLLPVSSLDDEPGEDCRNVAKRKRILALPSHNSRLFASKVSYISLEFGWSVS